MQHKYLDKSEKSGWKLTKGVENWQKGSKIDKNWSKIDKTGHSAIYGGNQKA